jgi:hypothetical protein
MFRIILGLHNKTFEIKCLFIIIATLNTGLTHIPYNKRLINQGFGYDKNLNCFL